MKKERVKAIVTQVLKLLGIVMSVMGLSDIGGFDVVGLLGVFSEGIDTVIDAAFVIIGFLLTIWSKAKEDKATDLRVQNIVQNYRVG